MEQKSEFVQYIDAYERWYFTYIEPLVSKDKKTPIDWFKGLFAKKRAFELKHLPAFKLDAVALGFNIRQAKIKALKAETDESIREELSIKFNIFHDYVEKIFNI
jgi:hypothetical protein